MGKVQGNRRDEPYGYLPTAGVSEPGTKVYPNQINSFTRYFIMNMEVASRTNPEIILTLRRVSNFIPLPHLGQRPLAPLDCSGPAKSDGYFALLDNDGNLARTLRHLQHLRQRLRVMLDIEVGERDVSLGVVLTGRRGVGSGILPVNDD